MSGLVSAGARGGVFTKTWPEPSDRYWIWWLGELLYTMNYIHIEGPTHATASAGYVTFLIYFLDEILL